MTPSVVQLVPTLPPRIDGIRDYALRLAQALRMLGMESALLAAHGGDGAGGGFPMRSLPERSAEALEAMLSDGDVVLLHYCGYGYAARGAPVWLARGLRRWKAGAPRRRRLVVMFHELWALGPPWTSSFWTFPLQRRLVAALLRLADASLTNTGLYAARLRRVAPHRSAVAVLPVFSNVGEPDGLPPFETREAFAVAFGQPAARERVYTRIGDFLPALRSAGIKGILDIGPPVDGRTIARSPLPVTECGYLDSPSASAAMLRARIGLVDYPLDFAAKSGVFAAYAAHGLVPVVRSAADGASDGLRHGVNLVRTGDPIPPGGLQGGATPQRLAAAAHLWYRDHASGRAAACFARTLCPYPTCSDPAAG